MFRCIIDFLEELVVGVLWWVCYCHVPSFVRVVAWFDVVAGY